MRLVGESVIGLTIMPLSDRLTRSTSEACSSTDRFLWMMPMPPCCAIAIASRDSVTVSIAALSSGTLRRMLRVTHEVTSTALGSTVRMPRHEQHVVERQRRREADGDLIGVQNVGSGFHERLKRKRAANNLLPSRTLGTSA